MWGVAAENGARSDPRKTPIPTATEDGGRRADPQFSKCKPACFFRTLDRKTGRRFEIKVNADREFRRNSFETLRTVELRQIAIEGAERNMARFACDLEHQAIRKS